VLPDWQAESAQAWSRRRYPEQYAESNLRRAELAGLDDRTFERFLDVSGRAYSERFISGFSYTDPKAKRPRVNLEYLARGETFIGRLSAEGLKPNFAYQLKLRGVPADPVAFRRIGVLGRWEFPAERRNLTDAEYEAMPDKSPVRSYVLFDFFITDGHGRADKRLYADSSFHVLWNLGKQRAPDPSDGVVVHAPCRRPEPWFYANPSALLETHYVYGEAEKGQAVPRPAPGAAFLPAGNYRAEFVLTEESFHHYGDGGYWATVMAAPAEFEVADRPRPQPGWRPGAGEPVTPFFDLAQARAYNIDKTTCTPQEMQGQALNVDPAIEFAETVDLPAGARYYLVADVLVSECHTCQVMGDTGKGFNFDEGNYYAFRVDGPTGWRRIEVEVTRTVAGRQTRLRLDPACAPGPIGLRQVRLYRLPD
jgi:hypothetical protein